MHTGPHHVEVDASVSDEDERHVRQDEEQKPPERDEMDRASLLPVQCAAEPAEPV